MPSPAVTQLGEKFVVPTTTRATSACCLLEAQVAVSPPVFELYHAMLDTKFFVLPD